MKILSDFDGVFTDPAAEAAEVGERLLEIVGDRAVVDRLRAEVRARPAEHGWISKGILACYADEDPYVFHNAVAAALYSRGPRETVERLLAMGLSSHEKLSMKAFEEGTRRFRDRNASHVSPEALDSVRSLVAQGHRIVIVSNSSTDRIVGLLAGAGYPPDGAGLSVRGEALKFVVGESPAQVGESATHGGRAIRLRRPHYYEILQKERPDALIGDVLSLDLALPAALRDADPNHHRMRVLLRRQTHTPPWALRACESWGIEAVESLAALRTPGRAPG
jgi:phosphoglycolate phosphatase-like HAD superfamily hydrolase